MSRTLLLAAVVGIAAPAWAQQVDPSPLQPEVRFQVQVFETNLFSAVQRGGQQLARRAREIQPDVSLQFTADPIVRGVITPEGAWFDVQIPEIMDTGLALWRIMANRGIPPAMRPTEPGRVNAAGTAVVTPDPTFEPDKEYTAFMRQALIDAMLDNALALPITTGQVLMITASGISGGPTNPLGPEERKLILRLKGEDLIALRQGRITREEARQRIMESRF
jgi:hypothetical protein